MTTPVSELVHRWYAVHDALPTGWHVNRRSWHMEDYRWRALAADHRPGRKRPESVEGLAGALTRKMEPDAVPLAPLVVPRSSR